MLNLKLLLPIPLMLLTGCATDRINQDAICKGTMAVRDAHTDALVSHGEEIIRIGAGDILVTGRNLIGSIDAACANK